MVSITVSNLETSYIYNIQMPSPIYLYVISLVVSLPIRRGPGVLMNVSVGKHCAVNNQDFLMWHVYYSNTIIITILM